MATYIVNRPDSDGLYAVAVARDGRRFTTTSTVGGDYGYGGEWSEHADSDAPLAIAYAQAVGGLPLMEISLPPLPRMSYRPTPEEWAAFEHASKHAHDMLTADGNDLPDNVTVHARIDSPADDTPGGVYEG